MTTFKCSCAEFIVSRQAVHSRPIEFYQAVLEWLDKSDLSYMRTGYVMEFIWHYIFTGKEVYIDATERMFVSAVWVAAATITVFNSARHCSQYCIRNPC